MEKLLSELITYDVININDGNKYGCLGNNNIAIDKDGKFVLLILGSYRKGLGSDKSTDSELKWDVVKRIGARTVIIDA